MGHSHDHGNLAVRRAVWWVTAVVALATVVGAVVLWPRGPSPPVGATTAGLERPEAVVRAVTTGPCTDIEEGLPAECQIVDAEVTAGSTEGDAITFTIPSTDFSAPDLRPGDGVVLLYNPAAPEAYRYTLVDLQRSTPLLWALALFGVAVVAFGRWQGVRALAALTISIGIVLVFLLPSLLRDNNAVAVALVASSLVAFAALYLTHGITTSTTVALLGTLASLVAITVLSYVFVEAAHLSGLADEDGQILSLTADALDPRGVLLAGIVVGALGVLDDVTITQVAAVGELQRANPGMSRLDLYRRAVRIGRDHVSSTVNTLVLAYVGASLALMLFFLQEGRALSTVATGELVATEIIRALVGSIGLVLSVPLTTGLAAAALSTQAPPVDTASPGRLSGYLRARMPSADRSDPPS